MSSIEGSKGKTLGEVAFMVLGAEVRSIRFLGRSRDGKGERCTYTVKAGKNFAVITTTESGWVREEEIERKIREDECST